MSRTRFALLLLLGCLCVFGSLAGCQKEETIDPPKAITTDTAKIPPSGGGAPESAHK